MVRTALALVRTALSLSVPMLAMLRGCAIQGNGNTISALGNRGLIGECFVSSESLGYGPEGGWLGMSPSAFTHSALALEVLRILAA